MLEDPCWLMEERRAVTLESRTGPAGIAAAELAGHIPAEVKQVPCLLIKNVSLMVVIITSQASISN